MYTPIVMPRSSKYGNNFWVSEGPKVGKREVILYSDLEFDHWIQVETDFQVETYCEQPLEISYSFDGEMHTTIFDMWIKLRNKQEMFREVKYESELNPNAPKNNRTFRQVEAQRIWCNQNNFHYEVVTEKTIRANYFSLENRLKILSHIKNNNELTSIDIINHINHVPISTEKLALLSSQPYKIVLEKCMWLIYKGSICADLETRILSKQTEVWLKNEP